MLDQLNLTVEERAFVETPIAADISDQSSNSSIDCNQDYQFFMQESEANPELMTQQSFGEISVDTPGRFYWISADFREMMGASGSLEGSQD